jgi:hypothetical protein
LPGSSHNSYVPAYRGVPSRPRKGSYTRYAHCVRHPTEEILMLFTSVILPPDLLSRRLCYLYWFELHPTEVIPAFFFLLLPSSSCWNKICIVPLCYSSRHHTSKGLISSYSVLLKWALSFFPYLCILFCSCCCYILFRIRLTYVSPLLFVPTALYSVLQPCFPLSHYIPSYWLEPCLVSPCYFIIPSCLHEPYVVSVHYFILCHYWREPYLAASSYFIFHFWNYCKIEAIKTKSFRLWKWITSLFGRSYK